MRTTAELREGFLSYFEEKGHLRRPSASLVPRADDRSTLLVTAGMQPQMPYFLGREQPPAVTSRDRKSTRLNSSHGYISYAVFCLKKKKKHKYNYSHE